MLRVSTNSKFFSAAAAVNWNTLFCIHVQNELMRYDKQFHVENHLPFELLKHENRNNNGKLHKRTASVFQSRIRKRTQIRRVQGTCGLINTLLKYAWTYQPQMQINTVQHYIRSIELQRMRYFLSESGIPLSTIYNTLHSNFGHK